jgi:hypothetical protein
LRGLRGKKPRQAEISCFNQGRTGRLFSFSVYIRRSDSGQDFLPMTLKANRKAQNNDAHLSLELTPLPFFDNILSLKINFHRCQALRQGA